MMSTEAELEGFEVFEGYRTRHTKDLLVSISKRGVFLLNSGAYIALGKPDMVVLLWSRQESLIGLRVADARVAHAFSVQRVSSGNTFKLNSMSFLKHYGIEIAHTQRYTATMREDMLIIAINTHERIQP